MASQIIPHIEEIKQHIDANNDFVVNGGAGSGKTFTLIESLKYVFDNNPNTPIACITYTNVAVNEIKKGFPYENLWVSTIHEFIWDNIKNYRKNIIDAIIALVEDGSIRYNGEIELEEATYNPSTILYKEYQSLENGIISHNSVLKIGYYLFKTYPLINRILTDKFNYIFIDEYQDTNEIIVKLFLEEFIQHRRNTVLGFFGDPMQSIYATGIGNLTEYEDILKKVIINGNRRCSESVINVLNKLRSDLEQCPENNNKIGSVKFLYSFTDIDINKIKNNDIFNNWNFDDINETKELYLTHRLIADKYGFSALFNAYREEYGGTKGSDKIIGDKSSQDALAKHLHKLQHIIDLYETKQYNEFLKKTDFVINYHIDKENLYTSLSGLENNNTKSINEIVTYADSNGICRTSDSVVAFAEEKKEFYNCILKLPYTEVIRMYEYVNEFSPYSTQHGVKGAEFENVLVVLDNGNWNNYNFEQLLGEIRRQTTFDRTLKLVYVCCSRPKNNLVIICPNFKDSMLERTQYIFGRENVILI